MSALNRFLRPKKAAPVIDLSVADIGNLGDDTPHCDCPYEYNHEDNFSMHRHELRCDLAPDVDEWNWYPHDGELEDGGVGIPEHFRASLTWPNGRIPSAQTRFKIGTPPLLCPSSGPITEGWDRNLSYMTIEEVKELPIGAMVEVREISPRWPNCWRLVILRTCLRMLR